MGSKPTVLIAATLALASSGCAGLTAATSPDAPIVLAYTAPVETIERGAAGGHNASQFALSFLALYGLRGVETDPARALALRRLASHSRRSTIAVYVPPVGEGRGQTNLVPITVPGLSEQAMSRLQMCGVALLAESADLVRAACVDPRTYDRAAPAARAAALGARQAALRAQAEAAQAAADNAASTPLP